MTERDSHTFLPCPFCGEDAHYEPGGEWQYYDTWAVECVGCGAQINGSTDMRVSGANAKTEALTAWNTRAVNSRHDLIEALRAFVNCARYTPYMDGTSTFAGWSQGALRHAEAKARAILTKAEAGHG